MTQCAIVARPGRLMTLTEQQLNLSGLSRIAGCSAWPGRMADHARFGTANEHLLVVGRGRFRSILDRAGLSPLCSCHWSSDLWNELVDFRAPMPIGNIHGKTDSSRSAMSGVIEVAIDQPATWV